MKPAIVLSVLSVVCTVDAFHVIQLQSKRSTVSMRLQDDEETLSRPSMVGLDEHFKDCVGKFGECTVEELEQLKEEIHQKRVQNVALGSESGYAPEDIFEQKLLEEELDLQLSLLKEEMSDQYLFNTPEKVKDEKLREAEQSFLLEELVEEGTLDSLAICALIGFMMIAPQILK